MKCRRGASGSADVPWTGLAVFARLAVLTGLAVLAGLAVVAVPPVLIRAAPANAETGAVAQSAKPARVVAQSAKPARVVTHVLNAARTVAEPNGHEQFRLMTHSATSRRQQLRATGVLDARGHALAGRVIAGRARNWLVVPHGAIRLITMVTRTTVTPPTGTCRFTETYTGTYRIRGGARRYASARGYGTYVTKIVGRLTRKHGQCTSTIAYFSQSTVTSGSLRW